MDQIARERPGLEGKPLAGMDDFFPATLPAPKAPGKQAGNEPDGGAVEVADHRPLLPKRGSIQHAERQAKIIVLTTALAAWAYLSLDLISLSDLLASIQHRMDLGGPASTQIQSPDEDPSARP